MDSNIEIRASGSTEDDTDWSQFTDTDSFRETTSTTAQQEMLLFDVPPQLHPAVSFGVQRVSSCYFSLASEESVADFMNKIGGEDGTRSEVNLDYEVEFNERHSSSILYHDILMNVFTFLNAQSLAAFSETARRPNFEVFYFLQLQLQKALVVDGRSIGTQNDSLAGSSFLSRLAKLDPQKARHILNEYLESNSTLRTMPLSHSINYMRHYFLQSKGFQRQFLDQHTPQSHALASAALLATVMGAAYMSGGEIPVPSSFGTELPNMLFRFGFVGSLMGAARKKMTDTDHQTPSEGTTDSSLSKQNNNVFRFTSMFEDQQQQQQKSPILSNPYDHPNQQENNECKEETPSELKMPSGCVGAYSRAIQQASKALTNIVRERRKIKFCSLPLHEQREMTTSFLDACSSDSHLPIVKQMTHSMDVDGFHNASDGSETCALHTAAFQDSSKVLDYLLQGIHDSDSTRDGGLCDVNCKDSNGWTALHFAAGSNSVTAIQVLARHGADLSVEANNGYSPLQWALRLSNEDAASVLKELIDVEAEQKTGWMSKQPLAKIANRFFSLMPTP